AGEVRPAPRGQERLREAANLGFTRALVPRANLPKQRIEGLEAIAIERLSDALEQLNRF
ncbi:MAG: DNA repair protein RadA, partial [Burkholderiales bacterium]|nr:DNA repair protein RadA [Burkholderiales bacterium]